MIVLAADRSFRVEHNDVTQHQRIEKMPERRQVLLACGDASPLVSQFIEVLADQTWRNLVEFQATAITPF